MGDDFPPIPTDFPPEVVYSLQMQAYNTRQLIGQLRINGDEAKERHVEVKAEFQKLNSPGPMGAFIAKIIGDTMVVRAFIIVIVIALGALGTYLTMTTTKATQSQDAVIEKEDDLKIFYNND